MAKKPKKPSPKKKIVPKKAPKAKKAPKTRQPTLPAMAQVRDRTMDGYCEGIGDARALKNKAVQEEKGYIQGALNRMHKTGQTVYKHAGVEVVLVPGDDKLRVRLISDGGDGEKSEGAEQAESGDGSYVPGDDENV